MSESSPYGQCLDPSYVAPFKLLDSLLQSEAFLCRFSERWAHHLRLCAPFAWNHPAKFTLEIRGRTYDSAHRMQQNASLQLHMQVLVILKKMTSQQLICLASARQTRGATLRLVACWHSSIWQPKLQPIASLHEHQKVTAPPSQTANFMLALHHNAARITWLYC
jgi:hypothetical protein